jgi:DNA polymerase-3 subunit gamma/tau
MVFYRKYRSQKIDELDNKHVRDALFSVLSKGVPHAFLFIGPKGLGKTSAARILAKAVNCERLNKNNNGKTAKTKRLETKDIEPCNECEQCKSITNGTNMDVVEIDGASNRGIDEIRDVREKVWLAPIRARKKVYIIDEVHMLTTEAFNALLKTIEEPPEHVIFVLCTTEAQKIPATVLSRCFKVQFNLATEEEIVRSLERIAKGEGLEVESGAFSIMAKMAEGGFRDAAKIFEEIYLLSDGNKITKALVEDKYKVSSTAYQVESIYKALEKKDGASALQIVETVFEQGVSLRFFIQQMIEYLHEQILLKVNVNRGSESSGGGEKDKTKEGNRFRDDEILLLYELFSKAYADMKYAVIPHLPLELAVLEFTRYDGEIEEAEVKEVDDPKDEKRGFNTMTNLRRQVNNNLKVKAISDEPKAQVVKKIAKGDVELMQVPADGNVTSEWMDALWKSIISEMKGYNHTIAGVLRSCGIESYNRKLLVIGTDYKFHKERLDDVKARLALKRVCKLLTGKDVEIEVELRKK